MMVDGLDFRTEIKETAHTCNDGRQQTNVGEADADDETLPLREMRDFDASHRAIDFNGAQITVVFDDFDTGNGAGAQVREHAVPVVRGTVAETERHIFFWMRCRVFS